MKVKKQMAYLAITAVAALVAAKKAPPKETGHPKEKAPPKPAFGAPLAPPPPRQELPPPSQEEIERKIREAVLQAKEGAQTIARTLSDKEIFLVTDQEYTAYLRDQGVPESEIGEFLQGFHRVKELAAREKEETWWPVWLGVGIVGLGAVLLIGPELLFAVGIAAVDTAFTALEIATLARMAASLIIAASQGTKVFVATLAGSAWGLFRGRNAKTFLDLLIANLEGAGITFLVQEALGD